MSTRTQWKRRVLKSRIFNHTVVVLPRVSSFQKRKNTPKFKIPANLPAAHGPQGRRHLACTEMTCDYVTCLRCRELVKTKINHLQLPPLLNLKL